MMELPQKKYSHHHYLDACKIWFNPDGPRAASELKQLPLAEREQVWADLTGREATTTFTQNVKEDAEMLKTKLLELESALETAEGPTTSTTGNVDKKRAFDLARESNPKYIRSEAFRLKFLRASGYDPEISASRMMQHFEMKRDLFGEDTLGRDILITDLDGKMVESGCCQPLQGTDIGGRTVVVDRPGMMSGFSRKSLFQWIWYIRMVLTENENIQKLGIVNVVYCLDEYCRQDLEAVRQFHSELSPAIPLKISARYAVYEDDAWKQILDFEQVIMKQPARMRFRSIGGSYETCMHSLMCVGIPIQSMPSDILDTGCSSNNNCKVDYLSSWVEERRIADSNKRRGGDDLPCRRKSKRARKN